MATLDGLTVYLDALSGALPKIARVAAPQIEAKLRADATTKRGNVPAFSPGPKGSPGPTIPITAEARGPTITVTAPDWVLQKAIERGQVSEWIDIAEQATREVLGER